MAISDAVQTLSAAFTFGIVLQAATGALFLYYKGHGKTLFKDGRRLVLVLFLVFAALWAQIDFINLMLPTTMNGVCQATLLVSTAFDQLGRVAMEQFLLWLVGHGTKLTTERLILQGVSVVRLIGGGLLIGFTRPDFAPTCVASTSVLPIAIVVLVLDAIIIGVLLVRALSLGMFNDMVNKESGTREQSKALVISVLGFGVWTGTSVPMILGIPTIILIVRTVVPANGLLILVGIVTMFPGALLSTKEDGTTPEARSPFMNSMPPSREVFRGNVNNNGSPIVGHGYTKSGSLFVVNPSTPNDSPTNIFQSSSRGDTRGFTKLNEEITIEALNNDVPTRPQRPERPAKDAPGYRGSSGVFPSLLSQGSVPGAMAPQMRPTIRVDTGLGPTPPAAVAQQKRSFFSRSKPPQKSIRGLGISQPVSLNVESSPAGVFARMQTTDLATAALNERERREGAARRAQLVANRPAPQPPVGTPEDALRRSISLKRKEMPSRMMGAMPTIPTIPGSTTGSSVEVADGSTTSASLSPGRDEVRRRSPRSGNGFNLVADEKSMTLPSLQRKQTLGLPTGPRSQRMPIDKEISMAKDQRVMFMNDIVYENPGIVKTIINGAPGMYAKRPKPADKASFSSETSLSSSGSIMHRPRPYKRDASKDRQLFPSEPSPGHKRSKSGGSITSRKSFLRSLPGSPTQLPPLPPPPTSASKLTRLLPNNTKSMTFNEKIQLLFPAPPGVSTLNRRSSVPSLPRVPSVFMADTPSLQSPVTGQPEQNRRASKRTTIASFALDNLDISASSPKLTLDRQTYRFSANTYRDLAGDAGEASQVWESETTKKTSVQNSLQVPARQSIIEDMRKSHFTEATTSDESSADDTSFWGSIHSEIPPIDIARAMTTAQTTYIKRVEIPAGKVPEIAAHLPRIEVEEVILPIMPDSEEPRRSFLIGPKVNRESFFLEADESLPEEKSPSIKNERGWHRRIGDELPTFSERMTPRSRKMPPPTPLLLSKNGGRKATVVVRSAEPSPPTDSPERAIKEIQEQLRRFEEPNRISVDSLLQRLPNQNIVLSKDNDRLQLLENLEMEMGQQENHWQQMQTDLNRDSMSVVMTPQPSESDDLSRESSQRSSHTPFRIMDRRARVRSSMTMRSKGEDSSRTTSTQSSDNSRASVWQQRLAEAQMEYMSNAPDLLRKRSLNFLHVSKVQEALGSPTPPESLDSETEIESASDSEEIVYAQTYHETQREQAVLWQKPNVAPQAASGRMWSCPFEKSAPLPLPEPPAKSLRPAQRRTEQPLQISSIDLWAKPRSPEHSRPVVALWGSRLVRPRSIVTRPVTQRPLRKSKRITFLPDIVESPSPLPNKRETLGIFQFPWGEKSDQAVYQPAFNPALLAGPRPNTKLDARSRQLEPEPTEYSSSFFDDYEEEEDDDDVIDPDSDDDFDETTLWEIASLLNSKDVPSKQSLLPRPRGAEIVQNYDESDSKGQDTEITVQPRSVCLPIQPLAIVSREISSLPSAKLWNKQAESKSHPQAGLLQPEHSIWNALLPASHDILRSKPRSSSTMPVLSTRDLWSASELKSSPGAASAMWQSPSTIKNTSSLPKIPASLGRMWTPPAKGAERSEVGLFSVPADRAVIRTTQAVPAAIKMVKPSRKPTSEVSSISSRSLWAPAEAQKQAIVWIFSGKTASQAPPAPSMWNPTQTIVPSANMSLFDTSVPRSNYRTSHLIPAAIGMVRNARTSQAPLDALTSTKLWTGRQKLNIERDWISESSVRPESPSVYSAASSRSASPTSDASSIKSTSTKASSVWAVSSIPTWSISKDSKNSPPNPDPVEDAKPPSKIPVRQPTSKATPKSAPKSTPLASVRESRVLASRDMWESKAPAVEKATVRKFLRRATTIHVVPKPTYRALRHQYRPAIAFRANWDDALAEAIAASLVRPASSKADWENALAQAVAAGKPRSVRIVAEKAQWDDSLALVIVAGTPRLMRSVPGKAEWKNALANAISRSHPRLQKPQCTPGMWEAALATAIAESVVAKTTSTQLYDPSVLHPVFFTERLVSNVTDIHPAAIGHVTKNYDASVLHPVSFTEKLISNVADIHPVSIGHVTKNYDSSVLHPVFFTECMVSNVTDVHPAAIGHFSKNYDASVLHPLFFTANLISSVTDVHPAAIGHMSKNYDASVLHPVFFTERLISTATDIHPAAIGHVEAQKATASAMWTPTSIAVAPQAASLWSKNTMTPRRTQAVMNISAGPLRKPLPAKSAELPILESTSFWKPSKAVSNERNCIVSKKAVYAQTWVSHALTTTVNDKLGMWIAKPKTSTTSSDQFTHIKHSHNRTSQPHPAALPRLHSKELFSKASSTNADMHWLHQTSKPARSMTWTAPLQAEERTEVGMWSASTQHLNLTSDLFAHLNHDHVRATPSRSAALPVLTSSELFVIVATKESITHWLHQTSKASRSMAKATHVAVPSPKELVGLWMIAAENTKSPSQDMMWTAPVQSKATSLDQFAHIKHKYVRAASPRQAALPELTSTALFSSSSKPAFTPKDWLHTTSASRPSRSMTWSAPAQKPMETSAAMWSAQPAKVFATPDVFAYIKHENIRASKPRQRALPQLTSTTLFSSSNSRPVPIDWLYSTSKSSSRSRSLTWNAPTSRPTQTSSAMWIAQPKEAVASPDIFGHIKSEYIRASAPHQTALPQLTSTAIFTTAESGSVSINWLHSTSSRSRSRSLTWTAPLPQPAQASGMIWVAPMPPTSSSPAVIFPNPHAEPWVRAKRTDEAVVGIESTELWHMDMNLPQSPRNWLVTRSFSKVEFRY